MQDDRLLMSPLTGIRWKMRKIHLNLLTSTMLAVPCPGFTAPFKNCVPAEQFLLKPPFSMSRLGASFEKTFHTKFGDVFLRIAGSIRTAAHLTIKSESLSVDYVFAKAATFEPEPIGLEGRRYSIEQVFSSNKSSLMISYQYDDDTDLLSLTVSISSDICG